jgi:dipeptidyl aminopeptidase/acylaminoacyl peptidase
MAALTATGHDSVQAVALSACPADLRAEPLDNGNEVARLMGPDAGVDILAAASPICHVHPAAPPVLLAHGSRDRVVPIAQSVAFRDALVSAGVQVRYVPIADASHEWADLPGPADGPETTGTFGALARQFFRKHL